jgi:uncharacterized transporter YbjL
VNLVASLRRNRELAIFLTLALGFLLGRVRLGTFKLGNVVVNLFNPSRTPHTSTCPSAPLVAQSHLQF